MEAAILLHDVTTVTQNGQTTLIQGSKLSNASRIFISLSI